MTTQPDPLDDAVRALVQAHQGGHAADDARLQGAVTSAAQAYAVQERVLARLGEPPGVARYWKSGSPSRADALLHAPLPRRGVCASGQRLDVVLLRHHWIEAEVALRIGRDVAPQEARSLTVESARALVDAMCVSVEVVDSRWASARAAAPLLKLADFLVHGALVLGDFVPFVDRDWAAQQCRVRIGAGEPRSFTGSLGIGDPAWVLPAWLQHATRNGGTVAAGTVVTTGTWCGLLEAKAGDTVMAEFPGIGTATARL